MSTKIIFNGKIYKNVGATNATKAWAKKYVALVKKRGYNARIVKVARSGMFKKHYEIYVNKITIKR